MEVVGAMRRGGIFHKIADKNTGRTQISLVGRSRERRVLRIMSSLQNFLDAILLTKPERAGPIPDWEGGMVVRCVLDILSWKPSLTSQTKTGRFGLGMKVLGWKGVVCYNNNL